MAGFDTCKFTVSRWSYSASICGIKAQGKANPPAFLAVRKADINTRICLPRSPASTSATLPRPSLWRGHSMCAWQDRSCLPLASDSSEFLIPAGSTPFSHRYGTYPCSACLSTPQAHNYLNHKKHGQTRFLVPPFVSTKKCLHPQTFTILSPSSSHFLYITENIFIMLMNLRRLYRGMALIRITIRKFFIKSFSC